jgi:hypothetical protein
MLGNPFATETVTRQRATTRTDRYGQTTLDWTAPATASITTLAPAEPRPSSEPVQDARNSVTDGWTLYLPEGSDVTPADRMVVRGDTHFVIGEPSSWLGAGLVVQTSRTEG